MEKLVCKNGAVNGAMPLLHFHYRKNLKNQNVRRLIIMQCKNCELFWEEVEIKGRTENEINEVFCHEVGYTVSNSSPICWGFKLVEDDFYIDTG